MTIDWNRFCQVVRQSSNIVLISHIRPDCDALGSELAMAEILKTLGKRVRIVNGQATPPTLAFLDPQHQIKAINVDIQPGELDDVDLFMILDTSARVQLGGMMPVLDATSAKKVVLDHHVSNDELGAEAFKDTTSEATGCLVMEAARRLEVALTPEIATPLFAAIATDTGWFRFNSVKERTYLLAAELVRAGASPSDIFGNLYEEETAGRVRLRGVALSRIEVELDGRFAHMHLLNADYGKTGALPSDTEDLINEALKIEGTQFAVIMIEQPTGGFKISFRSRCEVSCNDVASKFGGGGHKAAAGAFVKANYDDMRTAVLSHVRNCLK